MFSLEIIIPIIVVAAVCAVYIILRGRRDERRAREAGEKLRPIPMDDPLVAGGAGMRPAPDPPIMLSRCSIPMLRSPRKNRSFLSPNRLRMSRPSTDSSKQRKKRSALLTRRKLRPPLKPRNPRAASAIRQSPPSTA